MELHFSAPPLGVSVKLAASATAVLLFPATGKSDVLGIATLVTGHSIHGNQHRVRPCLSYDDSDLGDALWDDRHSIHARTQEYDREHHQ
jgi:hypothetical protein